MRKQPKRVTPDGIAEVREAKAKYPDMTDEMIGKLCDFSHATVRKILNGDYDPKPDAQARNDQDLALSVMELSEQVEKQNALLGAMALAMAVIIDPKSGKTSMPVADAIRQAVRGEKQ